ncbi:MAG: inositol monophosphatase [Thermoanaerobaculia bacterium]|nr:inositol monophosphatase [Thermoanaerobaculia bacterium]
MSAVEPSPEALRDAAIEAANAGAAVLARWFRSERLEVGTKGANDFVTQADRESEAAVVAAILGRFPEHRILAEEGTAHLAATSDHEWVIDPLDGTTNFLQGLPVWAVSIACRRAGELLAGVVLDPEGGNLFAAARGAGATWNGRPMRVSSRPALDGAFLATGYPFRARAVLDPYLELLRAVFARARAVRRCGAAALDLAWTAAGVYDGFFELRLSPWDIAAGALLVEEAGGRLADFGGGDDYLASGNVLAGTPGVLAGLLETVRQCGIDEALIDSLAPRG